MRGTVAKRLRWQARHDAWLAQSFPLVQAGGDPIFFEDVKHAGYEAVPRTFREKQFRTGIYKYDHATKQMVELKIPHSTVTYRHVLTTTRSVYQRLKRSY